MSNPNTNMNPNPTPALPPGFRFHPTDEELILHYLRNRAASTPCPVSIIAEVDIYKFDPWDLPGQAKFGDREWYFFSPRDRKYPNGVRPNRAAASGYWKATGTDKPIHAGNENIGVKKALVFYKGKPPKGLKTNWIMHEYRLADAGNTNTYKPIKLRDHSMRLDDWVLCRIYKKSNNMSSVPPLMDQEQDDSCTEDACQPSFQNTTSIHENVFKLPKSASISDLLEDYAALSHLFDTQPELPLSDFNPLQANPSSNQLYGGINYFAPHCSYTESPALQDHNGPSKRQRTSEGGYLETSKRQSDPCLVPNFSGQFDASQYSSFFNEQLLLNSHFGLH